MSVVLVNEYLQVRLRISDRKIFVVDGPAVQKVMRKVNIQDNESLHYFHKCLEELGVNEKLKQAGVQDGDTVRVVDWELEWYD